MLEQIVQKQGVQWQRISQSKSLSAVRHDSFKRLMTLLGWFPMEIALISPKQIVSENSEYKTEVCLRLPYPKLRLGTKLLRILTVRCYLWWDQHPILMCSTILNFKQYWIKYSWSKILVHLSVCACIVWWEWTTMNRRHGWYSRMSWLISKGSILSILRTWIVRLRWRWKTSILWICYKASVCSLSTVC